jgi:hypothetical protein
MYITDFSETILQVNRPVGVAFPWVTLLALHILFYHSQLHLTPLTISQPLPGHLCLQ